MNETLEKLQKKFKRGWYKKGRTHRFLLAINLEGFLLYQTKTEFVRNSKQVTGINHDCDDWFDKAEYLGLELPGK